MGLSNMKVINSVIITSIPNVINLMIKKCKEKCDNDHVTVISH